MKITTKNAKILVLGSYNEYRSWMNRYGKHIEGVKFERISSEKSLKSRHARTTRVLVLSDELGLIEKVQRLNPFSPGWLERKIDAKLYKKDEKEAIMTMAYGSGIREVHKSLNEVV